MRIIPADYDQEEESIFAKSLILGLLGMPLGVLIAIGLGFLSKEVPKDPIGWLLANGSLYATIFAFWWLATVLWAFGFWNMERKFVPRRTLRRILSPTLIIPLFYVYVSLLFAFVFNPFNRFFLQYYNPVSVFWLVALIFLPFMLAFVYAVVPRSRPTMRRNLRILFTPASWGTSQNRRRAIKFWVLLAAVAAVYILSLLLS